MLATKFLFYTCALLVLSYVASGHPMTMDKNGFQVDQVIDPKSAALGTHQNERTPIDCKTCAPHVDSEHTTSNYNSAKEFKPAGPVHNKSMSDGKDVNVSEKSMLNPEIVLAI
ncbi:secreted protein [Melampsora americana]|nr:secreted protein [Melampsora americana]